jgi:hypothetical protein
VLSKKFEKPWVKGIVLDILTFCTYISQKKFAHQNRDSKSNSALLNLLDNKLILIAYLEFEARFILGDLTYFSKINQQYYNIVQFLLKYTTSDLPKGVTAINLDNFKCTYANSAFTC